MNAQDNSKRKSPEDTIRIFVSYSHADLQWAIRGQDPGSEGLKDTLIPWLQEQLKNDRVEIWCDPKLKDAPHEDFAERIQKEIALADIALPLLSEEFANSEYIQKKELPPIKKRHDNKDIAVLSILVGPISKQGRQKIDLLFRPTVLPSDVKPLLNFLADKAEFRAKRIEILEAIRNTIEYLQAERRESAHSEVPEPPTTSLGTDTSAHETEPDNVKEAGPADALQETSAELRNGIETLREGGMPPAPSPQLLKGRLLREAYDEGIAHTELSLEPLGLCAHTDAGGSFQVELADPKVVLSGVIITVCVHGYKPRQAQFHPHTEMLFHLAPSDWIACPHCGCENSPSNVHCWRCGRKGEAKDQSGAASHPDRERVCPKCGAKYPADDFPTFCHSCGSKLNNEDGNDGQLRKEGSD